MLHAITRLKTITQKACYIIITCSLLFAGLPSLSTQVQAQTTCDLRINGKNSGNILIEETDSITITGSNIRIDGQLETADRDTEFFIGFDGVAGVRKNIPTSKLQNGTLSDIVIDFSDYPDINKNRSFTFTLWHSGIIDTGGYPVCSSFAVVMIKPLYCQIGARASKKENGDFQVETVIDTSQLSHERAYDIKIEAGYPNPYAPFSIIEGQTKKEVGFTLENKHRGYSYNLYVTAQGCFELFGQSCAINGCMTRITLDPDVLPTVNPTPFEGLEPGDGKDASLGIITCNNGKGIETSFGCVPTSLSKIIQFIFKLALGIGGGIAFLLIIWGGLRLMMSTGDPKKLQEGKEIITSAIVGLILIIMSVFVLRFIGQDVLCIPGFGINCSTQPTGRIPGAR